MMHIRPSSHIRTVALTIDNAIHAVRLGGEMHVLSDYKHIPFDFDHTMRVVMQATNDPEQYCRMSMDRDGAFTGIISGYVQQLLFSPRLYAMETAWFVRPNTPLRASVGAALMRGFIDWAMDDWQCVHVLSSDTANIASRGVDAIHRHLGFERCGTLFKLDPHQPSLANDR